jgi:hypothetical protein
MTNIEETHHIMLIIEVIHLYLCKRNTDGQNSKASIETSDTLSGSGTITGTIMIYYYGFLFTIIVKSIIGGYYHISLTNTIGNHKG